MDIALTIGLVSLLVFPRLLKFAWRIRYPVNTSGAVLVTGAGSGIGQSTAVALVKAGYTVYAGCLNTMESDGLTALAKEKGEVYTASLKPVILDVTKQEHVNRAKRLISELEEPMVGLVYCAGYSRADPIETADLAKVQYCFDVNLFGAWRLTAAFLPLLRSAPKGRIVLVGSGAGKVTAPVVASYSGTKHALEAFADTLRMEAHDQGVSVSLIQPGFVRTQFLRKEIDFVKTQVQKSVEEKNLVDLYGKFLRDYVHVREEILSSSNEKGMDLSPSVPARAIMHAIQSPFPETRYAVTGVQGIPASFILFLSSLLPDRVRDYMFLNS